MLNIVSEKGHTFLFGKVEELYSTFSKLYQVKKLKKTKRGSSTLLAVTAVLGIFTFYDINIKYLVSGIVVVQSKISTNLFYENHCTTFLLFG